MKVRIATRKSPLAVWQAEHVAAELQKAQEGVEVSLLKRVTKGDKILDQALSKVGGKDLFVKEIEDALMSKDAEVAVHSLKDMPTVLPEGLQITAYTKREDPRDALVSPKGYKLDTLPKGAKIGTSSLRRAAQLLSLRPDLQIVPIRGNVQTRLRKMDDEGMDGTILAMAGLVRLELGDLASEALEPSVCLPAIAQGILGVETRSDDREVIDLVSHLDDPQARVAATAERSFLFRLEGGCQVPIAGHTFFDGDSIELMGLVSSVDGKEVIRGSKKGTQADAESIGVSLAEELLSRGADRILRELSGR